MPLPTAAPPPATCDVLVVGAGPAGSACASELARRGRDVLLVDQHPFPRDKVCGDGLIPDAQRALRRLGVYDEVMSQARVLRHLGCIGPRGGRIDVPGQLAVLPRRRLDHILQRGAERQGSRFHAPLRFESALAEGGRVAGARFKAGDAVHDIRARWTVLATGAVPQALLAAGACDRQTPSAVAMRAYVRHPGLVDRVRSLEIVWHKQLRQGYGWLFPCPDGVFNIGVGIAHAPRTAAGGRTAAAGINLHEMFAAFTRIHAAAGELMAGGEAVGPLKGAPLRCSLDGARLGQPGLLVTGEAAGSTYAFTGEGIGKAMETGLLAADALLAATPHDDAAVCARYAAAIEALRPRFALYERANRVNDHPWLADLLIWRARRSPPLLRRMAGVLEETDNPGRLVSLGGIAKLLLPIR